MVNTDACTNGCKLPICGDGIEQTSEDCDEGANTMTCDDDCTDVVCGDSWLNAAAGETCDEGGDTATCDADCSAPSCGDGYPNIAAGEGCDDGNTIDDDACSNACVAAMCGDGVIQGGAGEVCDTMGESAMCDDDCTTPSCGDGNANAAAGEECDDGNMNNLDGCTNLCKVSFCGDGVVQMPEQCDDGADNDIFDGCKPDCTKSARYVYLTSSNGTPGFYEYDTTTNMWATMPNPPSVTYSQITNDGAKVYLLGSDNVVYSFDPNTNMWSNAFAGPNAMLASQPIGAFVWYSGGFYYAKDGSNTLYRHAAGTWTSQMVATTPSSAADWDAGANELYIRTYGQLGFQVVNTNTNMVFRTITDATGVGENSRTGSFSGGNFYTRDWAGSLQRFHGVTGVKTDTGVTPSESHTSTASDPSTGAIYVGPYSPTGTTFQRYNPADNTLTTLAASPPVSNHSTITVLRP
jgi:cysteine-rich repeat protein